jgi:hypothetical protein
MGAPLLRFGGRFARKAGDCAFAVADEAGIPRLQRLNGRHPSGSGGVQEKKGRAFARPKSNREVENVNAVAAFCPRK